MSTKTESLRRTSNGAHVYQGGKPGRAQSLASKLKGSGPPIIDLDRLTALLKAAPKGARS